MLTGGYEQTLRTTYTHTPRTTHTTHTIGHAIRRQNCREDSQAKS